MKEHKIMASNTSVNPLKIQYQLAPTPTSAPKYKVEVRNRNNQTEVLADPRATRALVALMNQHAVTGGAAAHWGGPAAFAEIMSSLHAIMFRKDSSQWYEKFNFVNDAGHTENGIYALRALYQFDNLDFNALKGFRSIDSKLTGHGEVHLNPQNVFISNGPLGSGVAQAQGLAMADKLQSNSRVTLCTLSDGGSMEGEAKEALTSIPGLSKAKKLNPFVLVISDNNTKLSGRIDSDSFDMNPSFESLETLGWEMTKIQNGHDLETVHQTLDEVIEKAKSSSKPQCVWVKTIKGYGVKKTMESASGGHGYPLKAYDSELTNFIQEIFNNEAPEELIAWAQEVTKKPETPKESKSADNHVKSEKVQPGFARAAIDAVNSGLPVVSISADLQGSTGIAPFHKEFPHYSFDIGVAESNMISAAIGLSKHGYIPIVDTFAQFGITKGNLPMIMAALSQGPVIALFSHIGFQDAADGASHQATTYLAAVSAIPNTEVICCSCSTEAYEYMQKAINHFKEKRDKGEVPNNIIFFFGRENHPQYYKENLSYEWKKDQIIRDGEDVTIVTNGPMLGHSLEAAEKLAEKGIKAAVVNRPFVNSEDISTISSQLGKTNGNLVTVEDHQIVCGMGAQLAHQLNLNGASFKLASVGTPGIFGQSAYNAIDLYKKYSMDSAGIIKAVEKLIN